MRQAQHQAFGYGLFVGQQALEHAARQQPHVFGKQAEHALREEVRHLFGRNALRAAALAQAVGQFGKALRGGFGDVAAGLAGLEAVRRGPDAAQQGQLFGLVEFVQAHGVGFAGVAGELGVHPDGEAVRHHQNGRVGQREAVGQQLLQRRIEVFAGGLVFPGKAAAQHHIGIACFAADDLAFFFKPVALGAAGLGHAQQFAQVKEVALRTLLFVQGKGRAGHTVGCAPFGDEILWGHACDTLICCSRQGHPRWFMLSPTG